MLSGLNRAMLGNWNIGRGPESAQVAHGQGHRNSHLGGHDDEASIPAQESDNKYERTTNLKDLISVPHHTVKSSKHTGDAFTFCNFDAISYCCVETLKYAPARIHAAAVTSPKMLANTILIFNVKKKNVSSAKPQTTKYSAIAALNAGEVVPVGSALVAKGEPRLRLGSCSMPKESQKTENRPITIIGKKLPMIHSKIMAKVRRSGPVKKNMPLFFGGRPSN